MNYIYSIKEEYRNDEGMAQAGFIKYESDDGEVYYAIGIRMPLGNPITSNLKKSLERLYAESTGKEKEEMDELGFDGNGKLIMDEDTIRGLTECQLCVGAQGEGQWSVFVNSPDSIEYYNSKVVDACAEKEITRLRERKIVRKTPVAKGKIEGNCGVNQNKKKANEA